MKRALLFVLTLTALLCLYAEIIRTNTNLQYVDEDGRERFFHGVNVVHKAFPWHPPTDKFDFKLSFCEQDAILLKSWGLNVVRLGVMWPGVEPVRGQFNETYLQIMQGIVETMERHGIWVLLDFHQDLLSEKFCGEGVPLWAAQPGKHSAPFPLPVFKPFELDKDGIPLPGQCNRTLDWFKYQFASAESSAYQAIYSNTDGLLDAFAGYWRKVADTFKNASNLLGYDTFNEPWAGDIYQHPTLLVPGVADKLNLAPMYDRLNAAIREVDKDRIMFFESVTWDDFGTGFEQAPGGPEYASRSALSYHYYRPPNLQIEQHMRVRQKDMKRLQVAGMLTEFDIANPEHNIPQIYSTAAACDRYLQSWIGWEFKSGVEITGFGSSFWNEDGTINMNALSAISRTYPHAVAGKTNFFFFDAMNSTKSFTLNFQPSEKTTKPSIIYLNKEVHYPNGVDVSITPNSIISYKIDGNYVYLYNNATAINNLRQLSENPVTATVSIKHRQ